jgi:wyosine [tRNA(Phe)-imidazoG37] synthetase (radical SAM superfamily)
VNRPHQDLIFKEMMTGFRAFRDSYQGKLWIEVFLVWGTNSVLRDVERIAAHVNTLAADEVHLNTAVRPPAESFAFAMPRNQMARLTGLFRPTATVIAEFPADRYADFAANEETILAMLKRRPCTARQIADGFGMHLNEVSKVVGKLSRTGQIHPVRGEGAGGGYFAVAKEAIHADL